MKDIGFNGEYKISKNGLIFSIKSNRFLSVCVNSSGYKHTGISYKGKRKVLDIHRLLALHYIDNPNNKEQVNHIDGNKLNNTLSNLEWVSASENVKHAHSMKKKKVKRKSKRISEKIKKDVITSQTSSKETAKNYNISRASVFAIKKRVPLSNYSLINGGQND